MRDEQDRANVIEIIHGGRKAEGFHMVRLTVQAGSAWQRVSAEFNPTTGEVDRSTISEWVVN